MEPKRVLIVDDDNTILRMLEFGLRKLGADYVVETVEDTTTAMQHIEDEYYDLIITDYMMPGMTGVDLVRAVHKLSPHTQVILMTAYGTTKLRSTTDSLRVDGFLSKPFTMDQFRKTILEVTNEQEPQTETKDDISMRQTTQLLPLPVTDKPLDQMTAAEHLQNLHVNSGSRAVLLIDREGFLLQVVGEIQQQRLTHICQLIAANHYGPAGLSNLIDNKNTFKASFYEGDMFNLYVCDVDSACLLAVIFDVKLRPGVVWFYTKQTASLLLPLVQANQLVTKES